MAYDLTPDSPQYRAQEAARVSEEPLLIEALESMGDEALHRLMDLPGTAHEERWAIACELKVIRGFRGHLRTVIQNGKQAAKRPLSVA